MPDALSKIREAGVGPTDIQQAAIGPGIGIFTRHSSVLNPDGSAMAVRDALKLINQVREELASEAQADYDPATRFAIDWFIAHGHRAARSGEAITMANAIGLGLADLERSGIFKTGEGQAQLMPRSELITGWSPITDIYPTAWEACQHLIRRLEASDGGVDSAAELFAKLGDLGEPAHQLAFRLYDICNNKGWAAEAQPYNNLIQEWDVIEERALAFAPQPPAQGEMAI
jgi:putative DNA methylase